MSLIQAEALSKTYRMGEVTVPALHAVSFGIDAGAFVAFVGPSGSGKSTLLNLIGTLDRPSGGRLTVADTDVTRLGRRAAAAFRGRTIGFVFQDFNLIPVLTVAENVAYPLTMVQQVPAAERRERVHAVLEAVGMAEQAHKRPDQISGGQKQRVAIARALVTRPALVLADEPTANLDSETAQRIIALMRTMRDQSGTTFIFSTHDPQVMAAAETRFMLHDGMLTEQRTKTEGNGATEGARA